VRQEKVCCEANTDADHLKNIYDYAPDREQEVTESKTIYDQVVDTLSIYDVIQAVNGIGKTQVQMQTKPKLTFEQWKATLKRFDQDPSYFWFGSTRTVSDDLLTDIWATIEPLL
jgi:hypothetical protein